jgi:predicted nicotinamide N-methyase
MTADRLGQLLRYHEVLLLDRARNAAFRRALAACIRPGDRVLDVGAGSGVWAVLAARLGARKVVAVEREPLLGPVIRRVVQDSGVADRVELVTGTFQELRLGREFDVVVSETAGNFAFDEEIVSILATARSRCLVPAGALVPRAIRFVAAPARRRRHAPQPALPVALHSFEELAAQFPRGAAWGDLTLVAPPRELTTLDLMTCAPTQKSLGRVAARWRLDRPQTIDGIVVWLRLDLAPGLTLDTRRCTNWYPTLHPIDAVRVRGAFEFVLEHGEGSRRWSVTFDERGGRTTREHCPELAFGAVHAAARRRNMSK